MPPTTVPQKFPIDELNDRPGGTKPNDQQSHPDGTIERMARVDIKHGVSVEADVPKPAFGNALCRLPSKSPSKIVVSQRNIKNKTGSTYSRKTLINRASVQAG